LSNKRQFFVNLFRGIILKIITWTDLMIKKKYFRQKIGVFTQNTAKLGKNCIIPNSPLGDDFAPGGQSSPLGVKLIMGL
jgi:hypothetical protein